MTDDAQTPAEDPGYLARTGEAVSEDGSIAPVIGGLPAVEGSAWDVGAPLGERGADLAEEQGQALEQASTAGVVGDIHLGTVVVNVQDMRRAVDFWAAALGYVQQEQDWNPEFMKLADPSGRGFPVSLQLAVEPDEEPVRVHLDLYTGEQARHVERLIALGATRVADWPYPAGADFIVLRDPDGNEFCVIDHP
mgnify:CR=1 FL=1